MWYGLYVAPYDDEEGKDEERKKQLHNRVQLERKTNTSMWWQHDVQTLSALAVQCEENPPVTGGFSSQKDK